MAENSKLKILNIMNGAEFGGAELFFERVALSLEKRTSISQKILIRANQRRFHKLKQKIENIEQIKFFNQYNPFCRLKIQEVIQEFSPHVVLTWMNRASQLIPSSKITNEVTVGRLGGFYKIKNYAKCDYLITNTIELKQYVTSLGWDRKRVEFIPNFVLENADNKIKLGTDSQNTILCMGRFHENKAMDIVIKAMSFLPDLNLLIVGTGKLKASYKALIDKYHLGDRVKIYNWSNNISQYLNSCSILVCPSRHEPFGNVIIDGWAHKIPVVVSNVGGPKKLIKHKINGLKFETDNVFDLVSKIKNLHSNKKLKRELIKNGFNLFKRDYSENVIIDKYINYFKKISRLCVE